jgi:two-component system, OmpR family, phosphate regulon response regulator PhoB
MSLVSTDIVLVVEPDSVTRETYRRALSGAGFHVNPVEDGAAAVSFLEQYRPAAVVFDPGLAQPAGIDLLQELRSRPNTKDVPAIVIVASDAVVAPAPLDTVVRKPVRLEQLVAAVEGVLNRSATSRYTRFYDEDAEEDEA